MSKFLRVIEKATEVEYRAEAIEGGFQIYTLTGEAYKKLKESTFKKYFKELAVEEPKPEKKKASAKEATVELDPEKKEKMIDKIKKMLKLAENNPSLEEGLSAALQAQKLMAKYNIHEEDVTLEEIKDEIGSVFSEQKHNSHLKAWRKQLALIVARNFRCKAYVQGEDVVFRGYLEDAKIALDVYLNLYRIGDKLACKACTEEHEKTGTVKGVYNSYIAGFLTGVEKGMNTQCTALMIIVPKEVEEEFKEFSAGYRTSKCVIHSSDSNLFVKGKLDGEVAVQSRGIEKKKEA